DLDEREVVPVQVVHRTITPLLVAPVVQRLRGVVDRERVLVGGLAGGQRTELTQVQISYCVPFLREWEQRDPLDLRVSPDRGVAEAEPAVAFVDDQFHGTTPGFAPSVVVVIGWRL